MSARRTTKTTPIKRGAPDRVAEHQRSKFIDALAMTGTVSVAAKRAGVHRTTPYEWRDADEAFRAAWDDALIAWVDSLETEAYDRAMSGSDTLLIFLLKGNRGEKYAERVRSEITGKDGGPIKTETVAKHEFDHDAFSRAFGSVCGADSTGDGTPPGDGVQ